MISGQELVAWGWISGINRIKFLGLMLRAQAQIGGFDGLLLPGDHAKGMRAYQESPVLQGLVVSFFDTRCQLPAQTHWCGVSWFTSGGAFCFNACWPFGVVWPQNHSADLAIGVSKPRSN